MSGKAPKQQTGGRATPVLLAQVQTFASPKTESCVYCLEGGLDLFVSSGALGHPLPGFLHISKNFSLVMMQISTAYLTSVKKAKKFQRSGKAADRTPESIALGVGPPSIPTHPSRAGAVDVRVWGLLCLLSTSMACSFSARL